MNHTAKLSLQIFAMVLVGATVFMGGCGPDNLDDPTYIADIGNSESANDAADNTATPNKPMMDDNEQPTDQQKGPEGAPTGGAPEGGMQDGGAPMAMPEGGAPVVGVAAIAPPTRVVQLPPAFVKLPPEFRAQPPVITQSGEQIAVNQTVLHQRDIHVAQPAIEKHLISKNIHTHHQYRTDTILHPSFRRDVAFAQTASTSAEVVPGTVVTAPTAVVPGIVGIGGPIFPGRPYCAPWYSGGLLRACGGPRILP